MQVSEQILTDWAKHFDKGDGEKLAKELGTSVQTISKAFAGQASEETILRITQFFAQKKQRICEAQKKLNEFLSENKA